MKTLMVALLVMVGCGDDGGSSVGGDKVACLVDADCYETTGNEGAALGLCQSLEGEVIDACPGTRTGCCENGPQTQCWFDAEDADAIQDLCESQGGTWTLG